MALHFAFARFNSARTCIVAGESECRSVCILSECRSVCILQMYVDLYVALCEHFDTFLRASDASTLARFASIEGEGQRRNFLGGDLT